MGKRIFNISIPDLYITPEDAKRLNDAAEKLREGPLIYSSDMGKIYYSTVLLIGIETLIALFRVKKESDI